jgi:hypothetical protein
VTNFRAHKSASGEGADADSHDSASVADAEVDACEEVNPGEMPTHLVDPPQRAEDVLHEVRADLYYIASDLRALAGQVPAQKATEILALSELIASLAGKVR